MAKLENHVPACGTRVVLVRTYMAHVPHIHDRSADARRCVERTREIVRSTSTYGLFLLQYGHDTHAHQGRTSPTYGANGMAPTGGQMATSYGRDNVANSYLYLGDEGIAPCGLLSSPLSPSATIRFSSLR